MDGRQILAEEAEVVVGALRHHDLDAPVVLNAFAASCRTVARGWSVAAVAVFAVAAVRYGVPGAGDYVAWQSTASVVALAVLAFGLLIAWRWEAVGGTMALVAAVGLGALAAIEYHPVPALAITLFFVVPAVLFLLAWSRTRTLRSVLVLATITAALLIVGGRVAFAFYAEGYGPTHPESALPALPDSPVTWLWSGGVTAHSAVVVASVPDADTVALEVRPVDTTTGGVVVDATGGGSIRRFEIEGLAPGTAYRYEVVVDGAADTVRTGGFTTFTEGPQSLTVALGSCARAGSNGLVFDAIRKRDPDLMIVPGDLYYGDIFGDDVSEFIAYLDKSLTTPAQAALYGSVPLAYVWDDHDYGPNDAASDSPSRRAALAAYRELVPHYPLALVGDEAAIAQAFTVGRVRFILTDLRSARTPQTFPDGPEKSMLGAEQRAWFEAELKSAAATHPVVVWVSSVPWITAEEPGADHWGGYATERKGIADFIVESGIDNLVMVAGDAHMVAIDDGTNNTFASNGGPGFAVVHGAALDRPGSTKGGPYTEGTFPGGGQFGLMTIDDHGDDVTVTLAGYDWTGVELVSLDLTFPGRSQP